MNEDVIYVEFVEWLNKAWWGMPEADDLLPLLRVTYTAEEALLLTGLPFRPTPLPEIASQKNMAPGKLVRKMDQLAARGLVFAEDRGGVSHYSLNDGFFVFMRGAFWDGKQSPRQKEMAKLVNSYYRDAFFEQYRHAHTRGLRAIPIGKTIQDGRRIMPYEDVASILEQQDYLSVSHCPCRQRKKLDEQADDCTHPTEVCLHFGRLGRYLDTNGLGRNIGLEEAQEILSMTADSGLVHSVSNWQQGVDTICNCCACCCLFLESYHVLGHARGLDPSNYVVRVKPSACKACGLCQERCPMDALTLRANGQAQNEKGMAPELEQERCIGCGVCVHKCPASALILVAREKTIDPPETARDNVKRFFSERAAASAKERS